MKRAYLYFLSRKFILAALVAIQVLPLATSVSSITILLYLLPPDYQLPPDSENNTTLLAHVSFPCGVPFLPIPPNALLQYFFFLP